ncbi:hypothetical protein, conserved [Eimeria brunetti]|uniref:Uncharacterized protein n=1 Tax=Eimeria brunetti TaxID=51314 RepID=U6LKX9_9EIME|nr:hypothetical protein, conserved [Eimeria brunetti]
MLYSGGEKATGIRYSRYFGYWFFHYVALRTAGEGATEGYYTIQKGNPGMAEGHREGDETPPASEDTNNPGEESSDTDGDETDEELPPLSPTVEKFDEAMTRICSPGIKDSLFENLGNSVFEAMGLVDRWMNSLLGAMTALESDSTALYEYLAGTGSLTAVVKRSWLFGLSIIAESVESLALLADGTNPNNILELSKQAASNALDVVPLADEMSSSIKFLSDACVSFSASNSLSGSSHKSLWCDIRKNESSSPGLTSIEKQMKSSAQRIIQINPKKYLDALFKKVTLPALNIQESFPTESIKKLFFTVFDVLAESEGTASKLLGWLEAGLCVDCAIYLAILLLLVLWIAWFFLRGKNVQSVIPATFWNILTWMAVLLLLVGGILGWVATLGRQGCSILIDNCLEQDKWDLLSNYVPVVEPLISQCLTKDGEGDLLAGVGVDTAYDQMLGALQETLNGFPTDIIPLDQDTSELAENYLSAAASFGALVAADPDSVAESRKDVFPEFLTSGMQVMDVDIEGETLYGLATLESLVAPWKLSALHPNEPADGEFIVREDNPIEGDTTFIRWLEDLKERKMQELKDNGLNQQKAEVESERFKVWTKNGIWWLQQKQKVLNLKYNCRHEDGLMEACGYAEMFGVKEEEMQASCMYNSQRDAAQICGPSAGMIYR